MSGSAFVVALLGAECTGKTTLAAALADALRRRGEQVAVVREALREFCDLHARTPRQDEQAAIAAEQARRIADAAATPAVDVVVADTSAWMVAVYSEQLFGDAGLYAQAEAAHRGTGLTLVMGLDLPWVADGLQRDGAHVREPVDTLLRAALVRAGVAFTTLFGTGPARLAAALAALDSVRPCHPGA